MNSETRALLYDALMMLRENVVQFDYGEAHDPVRCAVCHEDVPWHQQDCALVALRARLEVALGLTREGGTA